jgi:hypothetical protein
MAEPFTCGLILKALIGGGTVAAAAGGVASSRKRDNAEIQHNYDTRIIYCVSEGSDVEHYSVKNGWKCPCCGETVPFDDA